MFSSQSSETTQNPILLSFNTCAQITMARDSLNAEIAAAISPVGRETLNDRVYRELKKSIMSGAFKPGSELKLRSVAEALGTSLMPVRDAMRRLVAERALEMRPRELSPYLS
jgi:hypothetical protein